jgi:hypothetical protein
MWWSPAAASDPGHDGAASYGSWWPRPAHQAGGAPLDTLVAPAWVLPGQTDDQLLDLLIQWRSSRSTRVGPRAGDQPPMPTQQRVGLDEEARPADSGEDAADRGEQGAVSRLQPRAWNLAAQHAELVAQDEDLQVLAGVAAAEQGEQLDGAAQRQVGEFRQHQVGLYMDEERQGTES